jgi:hypothetical protein
MAFQWSLCGAAIRKRDVGMSVISARPGYVVGFARLGT